MGNEAIEKGTILGRERSLSFPSFLGMPSRGRHQSACKATLRALQRIETLEGVVAVIIGRSYGGKSLGKGGRAGLVKVQSRQPGGLKAAAQTDKGIQEIFVRCQAGAEDSVSEAIRDLR